MSTELDCLVIGHHQPPLREDLAAAYPIRRYSGAYRALLANSVPFRGERFSYSELLSELGHDPRSANVFHAPSWAAHYVVQFLRQRGLASDLVNFFTDDGDRLSDLLSRRPRVVAVGTTFHVSQEPIQQVVNRVRRESPGSLIVVGGPFVNSLCRRVPENAQNGVFEAIGADVYVVEAQGETALARIVERTRDDAPRGAETLVDLPNVVSRDGAGRWRRGPVELETNPMAQVDWRQFPAETLGHTVFMRTARSCVYKCAFCNFPLLAGGLELLPLEELDAELTALCDRGVRQVIFIDDTFNIPLPRFKEICRLFIRRGFPLRWYSMFRCGNTDRETFDLMERSGCAGVFLGIESGSQRVLDAMNKVAKISRYEDGIAELHRRGIFTLASYIIGFPPEDDDTVQETMDFIQKTKATYFRTQLFYLDTSTPVMARAKEFGLLGGGYSWRHSGMSWERACDWIERIYGSVDASLIAPAHGFDLESIAYLIGSGWSEDDLRGFSKTAGSLLRAGLSQSAVGDSNEIRAGAAALETQWRGRSLEARAGASGVEEAYVS